MTVDQKAQVANAREEQQMSNENETQTSAEVTSPISDEVVEAASEAGWEALRPRDWPTAPAMPPWATAPAYLRAESRITVRASLEAAYPAIRQQVAEEIAVALDERHRSNLALSGGDKGIIPRDGRVGLATGYQRAAQIAREHAAR